MPDPSPIATPTGRTLGDFAIKEMLGEGGFGAVFRATQLTLGREAVVKVLHAKHHENQATVQRFLREAKLASKLDHPYAAHIYAFGAEADGLLWIAMELVRGTPLNRVLRSQGPLPLDRFVPLLDRVCEVVHTAHEQKIIHRDIKPANVMVLSRAGRLLPKLLDFGIGKFTDAAEPDADATPPSLEERRFAPSDDQTAELTDADASASMAHDETPAFTADGAITQLGVAMGSPPYMAPEQWTNASLADARTDIYALGVMAFECLVGHAPFQGDTATVARAHARKAVPALGDGFPKALSGVIAKAMAKKRGDRYPTALAFAAAFRDASGVASEIESLPRLDETLRQQVLSYAPQPVAEAVALLDGARNAHQARDAAWEVVRAVVRYVGLCALACRTRAGPGAERDTAAVTELLRALRRRELLAQEWLELARGLTRPFAGKRDAYPLPELVGLFFSLTEAGEPAKEGRLADALQRLAEQHDGDDSGATLDDQVRERVARLLPDLAALLASVSFLGDYRLVVPKGDLAEEWMGVRRPKRATLALARQLAVNQPVLVDFDGRPVVALWPLAQTHAPSPGAPEEMFFFEGRGRRGARLAALPQGFELQDEEVWDWFRDKLLTDGAGEAGDAPKEAERPPYRGLASFGREDRDLFFGRERQVEAFVNRLRANALLAVVGPSGAGKSSFVQAGVAPALDDWRVITVRPGPAPVASLLSRLAQEQISVADVSELGDALRRAASPFSGPILLVVDQLEELFTLCGSPAEREAYTQALVAAARSPEDHVRVVLTLRDDFLVRAEGLPALRDRLAQGLQLLALPAPEDMLRMLVEPARRAGYEFDDRDLPPRMVAEVSEQRGALALLSFTAAQLWELRDRHFKQLPRKAYEAMGGVGGALARHAEETLASMTSEEQKLVREAFRHLVTADGTRAVLTRAELGQVLGNAAGADGVIEKLVAARLVTASEEDRVEVIHEALLAAWPRLVEWRREDAEGARLRDQLRAAARQWEERGRPRGLLWRAEALAEYQLWRSRYPGALTESEEAFGRASLADAARGKRIRGALVAATMVALVAGIVVLLQANGVARRERQRAEANATEVKARLIASREEAGREAYLAGDAMRALVYLNEAYQAGADDPALHYLLARTTHLVVAQRVVLPHGNWLRGASFSPDGTTVATAAFDKTVELWRAGDGALLFTLAHPDNVNFVSFSPDGAQVATSCADGVVRLWDASKGRLVRELSGHTDRAYAATFSPNGARLLTSSRDKTARVWDVASGQTLVTFTGHQGQVDLATWAPDGQTVATGAGDGTVRLWDARTGALLHTLAAGKGKVSSVSFDGESKRVLTSAADAPGRLWDAHTGELLQTLAHEQEVTHAAFSPDGRLAVTSSSDATARVWDTASGQNRLTLAGHTGAALFAAFSPDGSQVVTTSTDGSARLWSARDGNLVARFVGHSDRVSEAVFDRQGQQLITLSFDRTARLWDIRRSRLAGSIDVGAGVNTVYFEPSGEGVVIAGMDDRLRLWTIGKDAPRFVETKPGLQCAVMSPDGQLVAGSGADGTVDVWQTADHQHWSLPPQKGPVEYLEFDRSGQRLISVTFGGEAFVRDAHTGEGVREIAYPPGLMFGSFDAGAKRIVTGGADGVVGIWDVATGKSVASMSDGSLAVLYTTFDPSGKRILSANFDRTAKIWEVASQKLAVSLSGHTDWVVTAAFDPSGSLVVTSSPRDGTVKVWDAASGKLLDDFRPHTVIVGQRDHTISNASFDAAASRIVTGGADGMVRVWDASMERRDRAAMAEFVRCRVPFVLEDQRVLPSPTQCAR